MDITVGSRWIVPCREDFLVRVTHFENDGDVVCFIVTNTGRNGVELRKCPVAAFKNVYQPLQDSGHSKEAAK